MDYNFAQDLQSIRGILGMSQAELAAQIGATRITISRNEHGKTEPSDGLMETFYNYAYSKGVRLNLLKEMFWRETMKKDHKMLFHGAKREIRGALRVNNGRPNNDFGKGFYAGENYSQAVSFISGFQNSSVYILDFNPGNLRCKKYEVDQEWMMTIAYYRGGLSRYQDHPMIRNLVRESRKYDYIIAPIADNRMFQIINSFIDGEITDEQCKHCLAATNLGAQYVFVSEKAVSNITILERCYVPIREKEHYKNIRTEDARLGDDKVRLARIQYRGKGRYIDEILG